MDLKPAIAQAERVATLVVKSQIGISAYRTGNLQKSVSVVAEVQGDQISFVLVDPTTYGNFTDFGTRAYRASERGPFNPKPDKGVGGIIPRFWSTLDDGVMERIQNIFLEEIEKQAEKELEA